MNRKLTQYLNKVIMEMTDIYEYEIMNLKLQSKYTQLIFEDLMMILLDILVISGIFSVSELTQKNF